MSHFVVGLPDLFQVILHWWPKFQTLAPEGRYLQSEILIQAKPVLNLKKSPRRIVPAMRFPLWNVHTLDGHPGRQEQSREGLICLIPSESRKKMSDYTKVFKDRNSLSEPSETGTEARWRWR